MLAQFRIEIGETEWEDQSGIGMFQNGPGVICLYSKQARTNQAPCSTFCTLTPS